MCVSDIVLENERIRWLTRGFARSPWQVNRLGESDAEILRWPGSDVWLAITTDAVVEEVERGLYADPYLIGWMTVVANASDLAAVGADGVGILLNQTLPHGADEAFLARLQSGLSDACVACGLPVLGGDTNESDRLHMEATAIGTVPAGEVLTRCGCRPGDRLFASGPLGWGGAFAFERLWPRPSRGPTARDPIVYQPMARLSEGRLLRRFASGCMDTSDGALPTLDELMRRSGVGFRIEMPIAACLHPTAARIAAVTALPAWTLLAGPHGEFELLFTVPPTRLREFRAAAEAIGWDPIEIGRVDPSPGLVLAPADGHWVVDTAAVRNLAAAGAADAEAFLYGLLALEGCAYGGA